MDEKETRLREAEEREKGLLALSRKILNELEGRSERVRDLCVRGLYTDHKQWYLEQILDVVGEIEENSGPGWVPGISP